MRKVTFKVSFKIIKPTMSSLASIQELPEEVIHENIIFEDVSKENAREYIIDFYLNQDRDISIIPDITVITIEDIEEIPTPYTRFNTNSPVEGSEVVEEEIINSSLLSDLEENCTEEPLDEEYDEYFAGPDIEEEVFPEPLEVDENYEKTILVERVEEILDQNMSHKINPLYDGERS